MFNHELFAVSFARSVHVMREQPPVVATQKAALRAVYALISIAPATVRVYDGVLSIDDVAMPDNMPHIPELTTQLTAHGVVEIAIARGASPADLLALVRAIGVDAGGFAQGDGVERRMRDSGATGIAVLSVQPSDERPEGRRPASVTQAFEMAGLMEEFGDWVKAEPGPATEQPSLGGESSRVIDLGFDEVAAAAEPEPGRAAAAHEPDAAEPEPAAEENLPVPAHTPLGQALLALRSDPFGGATLDRLTDLSVAFNAAMQNDQAWQAVRAVAAAIMLEPGAPEGSPKNAYSIVLKRMLTREVLTEIAPLLLVDDEAAPATVALHRGGVEGADVLLGLLATAETMRERKAYMHALRGIPSGTDAVVHMLDRREWFVVRNVAELCGELRVEEAVDELAALLTHSDVRVQKAAAGALAKIGTKATLPPLLKVLKDGNRDLCAMVAAAVGRRAPPALAMPIAMLADRESNPDLLREYYRALGRIASPEAVQALVQAAQPGKMLSRKPTAARLGAVEGLKLAGGAAAIRALTPLATDNDKSVANAAKVALEAARAGAG